MRNPSRRAAAACGALAASTAATRRTRAAPGPHGRRGLSVSTYMLKALASLEGVRTMLGAFWNSVFRLALGVAG